MLGGANGKRQTANGKRQTADVKRETLLSLHATENGERVTSHVLRFTKIVQRNHIILLQKNAKVER